jgi:hypothetical protein
MSMSIVQLHSSLSLHCSCRRVSVPASMFFDAMREYTSSTLHALNYLGMVLGLAPKEPAFMVVVVGHCDINTAIVDNSDTLTTSEQTARHMKLLLFNDLHTCVSLSSPRYEMEDYQTQ